MRRCRALHAAIGAADPGSAELLHHGQALFSQTGCSLCHSPNLSTAAANFTGMSNATYHPDSDFALHHVSARLADGNNQGAAGADQFRTAPLWGLGQRLFFLHDGRNTELMQAIRSHYFATNYYCTQTSSAPLFYVLTTSRVYEPEPSTDVCNSEANSVINNYNSRSSSQQRIC